ncbi:MAG: TonB-dependent receptor plug domain-containing protein [Rhizobiales bacterium]|nr:TonB-dependent receptor plug domain-containing protein [Hyphomicrobiales bacterium]
MNGVLAEEAVKPIVVADATEPVATEGSDGATEPTAVEYADEVVVTSDRAGLLEKEPTDLLFGINKPLLETPRAATFMNEETIQQYGIETVDDLKAVSPGTSTASFYGVSGAVNIRGTLAETYFRGFKRIENRGTYETPLGAASRVDIVRGPPTTNFGAGKVGGFLNFQPKSAKLDDGTFIGQVTGEVNGTVGSYGKKNGSGEIGVPITIGSAVGGVYLYGELEDSDSFYRGIHPEHQMLQASTAFDFDSGWSLEFGGMYYHSDGYVQTPGWNRVTQDLIDNGTYITGQDTTIVDTDGNGRLTQDELGGAFAPITAYLVAPGFTIYGPDARWTLDTGVGTAHLDRRTVYISDADFSETYTGTGYASMSKELNDGSKIKLEAFYDMLNNDRFVSYGYPATYNSWVTEGRATYDFDFEAKFAPIKFANSVGLSSRYYDASSKESFNSGFIALDRRDLTVGATATDIIDSPFSIDDVGGFLWENDVTTKWSDSGIFGVSDMIFFDLVDVTLGARYDYYTVDTVDRGSYCFCATNVKSKATDGKFTYNASIMLLTPWGIRPYYTYAETSAVEVGQAGEVSPSLVSSDNWISDGSLNEAGIKFELLKGTLTGSLSAYEQARTRLDPVTNSISATLGRGIELEMRYLATDNLSFTFAGNSQRTMIKGPDTSYYIIRASDVGLNPADYYGGAFAVFGVSSVSTLNRGADYKDGTIPESVLSLYGNYITDEHVWGQAGFTAGVVYTTETSGKLYNTVKYPAYTLVNASTFYTKGDITIGLNVDNIFDETYFTPLADLYSDAGVLPGKGREWRLTAKFKF